MLRRGPFASLLALLAVIILAVPVATWAVPTELSVQVSGGSEYSALWKKSFDKEVAVDRPSAKLTWKLASMPTSATSLLVLERQGMKSKTFRFSSGGSVTLDLNSVELANHYGPNPGKYQATLYYDDGKDAPVTWALGTVNFAFAATRPLEKTPEMERLKDFYPLPEIHHIMQRKEKPSPPTLISLVFTGVVLLPWLFFIPAWTKLGVNIGNFPWKSPSRLFWAVAFLGSLTTLLGSFFLFWTKWNIFQALGYFAPIALALLVTGKQAISHYALSHHKAH